MIPINGRISIIDTDSPEAQKLFRASFTFAVARQCAHDAAILFGMVADGDLPDGTHAIAFIDTAVITYARPYSGNHGLNRLSAPPGLTSGQTQLHNAIRAQRNEAVAHSDPSNLLLKIFEPEVGRWEGMIEAVPESTKELHRRMYWDNHVQNQARNTAWAAESAWNDKFQSSVSSLRELNPSRDFTRLELSLPPRSFKLNVVE